MTKDTDQEIGQGKVCSKCGEWKLLSEYYSRKRKSGSLYYGNECKPCHCASTEARRQLNLDDDRANKREYAKINSAAAVERVRQWRKDPDNLARKNELERARRKDPEVAARNNEYNKEWRNRPENRERLLLAEKKRRQSDPEYRSELLARQKEYYSRPEIVEREKVKRNALQATREWKDNFNERRRERYKTDPLFFCATKCRSMVVRVAKKARTRKSATTLASLGYSPDQLRQRIECQFKPGMSWENHGEWHIDHKKPIWVFLQQGTNDPKIINALCNLQPMWGEENQAKGAKWPISADNDNTITPEEQRWQN